MFKMVWSCRHSIIQLLPITLSGNRTLVNTYDSQENFIFKYLEKELFGSYVEIIVIFDEFIVFNLIISFASMGRIVPREILNL